jgi:hypothetical protein
MNFLILNGYSAETELDLRAQRAFGLPQPGHSTEPASGALRARVVARLTAVH